MESEKNQKLFYTIGETAKMFKVNVSLIRFWEKEFEILKPKKNNCDSCPRNYFCLALNFGFFLLIM